MILVTGGTGTVGTALVDRLIEIGADVRLFVRDPSKAAHLEGKVEIVKGDLDEADSMRPALKGAEKVFLLAIDPQHEANFISAAGEDGLKHLVMISSGGVPFGVGSGPLHAPGEALLKESQLAWTILRPWEYMSNALRWAETIKTQSSFFEPTGEGQVAPIDPADISEVAARVLTGEGHESKTYELTGPELLSRGEMANQISDAIGKPVSFVDIPEQAYREQLIQMGLPEFFLDPVVGFYTSVKEGKMAVVHPDVEQILGRPPNTFAGWLSSNSKAFV